MELKWRINMKEMCGYLRSNRTFMELKLLYVSYDIIIRRF